MPVQSLGREDPLEEEMATHSSTPAWEIPWTEKPGWTTVHGGHKRVKHDLVTKQQQQFHRLVSGRIISVILGKGWGFPGIEPLPTF